MSAAPRKRSGASATSFAIASFVPITESQSQWVKDDDCTVCAPCSRKFNALTRRKHHCRGCGKIYCEDCSTYKLTGKDPQNAHELITVRACQACFDRYSTKENETLHDASILKARVSGSKNSESGERSGRSGSGSSNSGSSTTNNSTASNSSNRADGTASSSPSASSTSSTASSSDSITPITQFLESFSTLFPQQSILPASITQNKIFAPVLCIVLCTILIVMSFLLPLTAFLVILAAGVVLSIPLSRKKVEDAAKANGSTAASAKATS